MSHDLFKDIKPLFPDNNIPNFIKEIPQFGKCIYYLERYAEDNNLVFETKNIRNWQNSKKPLDRLIKVLLYRYTGIKKKIFFEFEQIDEINNEIDASKNVEDYYANILISGGVDSMCGAYHWVLKNRKKIIFTHIYHKNTPSIGMIRNFIKKDLNMPLIEVDGQFYTKADIRNIGKKERPEKMNISQTRTLLYLCNSVPINYALGIKNILVTENGPLTINPPFTSSHTFTNTTNPDFIAFFNTFLYNYFDNEEIIKVRLPFREYTKAELMASVPNDILNRTHSCSKFYYNKKSCFFCFPCYVRRFSAYAYGNYDDDIYDPDYKDPKKDILERYYINNERDPFTKDISYINTNDEAKMIKELIQFCYQTLRRNVGINEEERIHRTDKYNDLYLPIVKKCERIREDYEDIWQLLKRFALDMLTGLHYFFDTYPDYQDDDYYIWNYYNRKINKLITRTIIRNNFYEEIRQRIKDTEVIGVI